MEEPRAYDYMDSVTRNNNGEPEWLNVICDKILFV